MDNALKITKKELLDVLAQAFDKGWSGYLDLKETVIEGIVDNFITNHPPEPLPEPSWSYSAMSSTSPSNSVSSSFANSTYLTGVDWHGVEADAPSTYPTRRLTGVDWRAEYQQEVPPFPSPGVEVARANWSNISGTFADRDQRWDNARDQHWDDTPLAPPSIVAEDQLYNRSDIEPATDPNQIYEDISSEELQQQPEDSLPFNGRQFESLAAIVAGEFQVLVSSNANTTV